MTSVVFPADAWHLVQVVAHSACGYRAECLCGWASSWADQRPAAQAACRQHREFVAAPCTWLDAALSGLLDLQDDLADAVFWLAETWVAEVPTPQLCVRHVPVLVRCDTAADLARVAQLMEVRVRGDRVGKRFGRVCIDAVTRGGRPA
jgi:hypothetical protein